LKQTFGEGIKDILKAQGSERDSTLQHVAHIALQYLGKESLEGMDFKIRP
jgi:hypothetical protein